MHGQLSLVAWCHAGEGFPSSRRLGKSIPPRLVFGFGLEGPKAVQKDRGRTTIWVVREVGWVMHCLYKFVVEPLLPLLCMRLSAQEDALGQVWSMWLERAVF